MIDLSKCKKKPEIGEIIHVVRNHCCAESNRVDELYFVRDCQGGDDLTLASGTVR